MNKVDFTESFRQRTKHLTLWVLELFHTLKRVEETRIIGRQLLRSSSSVASNYRAACRARSRAEFYSKISIVVEEADETIFWLEILEEAELVSSEKIARIKLEAKEVLYVMSKARKTTSNAKN